MSTGRMKDQKDFDLEQIVRVIDSALESDDQRIKDALRALMTITVLCTAEHPDQAFKGPLGRLIEDMHNLNRRLGTLEDDLRKLQWDSQRKQVEPFTPPSPPYNPGSPWGPGGGGGSPGLVGPWIGNPNDPTKPGPMWGSSWSAGDDPNYKGSSASVLDKLDLDVLKGVK